MPIYTSTTSFWRGMMQFELWAEREGCQGKQFQRPIMLLVMICNIILLMNEPFAKSETRGRPRKNTEQKLPPISRQLFSQHCAVFYACCMVYVLEVFLKTKQEKRIGHSQGGFTIYEKCSQGYCFQTFEDDIREWGFGDVILNNRDLTDFLRTANGSAPKFVFKELVILLMMINKSVEEGGVRSLQDLQSNQDPFLTMSEGDLNRQFKYIRFTLPALRQLKLQKWSNEVSHKIKDLWRPFIKIVSYTIFCVQRGIPHNKYLKPFFSDAQHPEETIIGQLNLQQIVNDSANKSGGSSVGFTKIFKISEEEPQRGQKGGDGVSINEREIAPRSNIRPITLITFPSNPKLETVSPSRPLTTQGNRSYDELQEIEQSSPSKKVKGE